MKRLLLLLAAAMPLGFTSCIKNNPDPSWLYVEEWMLQDNISCEEGELTHKISDAWVFIDGKLIGVFEVPFKIPLLLEGEVEITLYPTVLNNGISATKKVYPFLEPYELTATLVKNETLSLSPSTRYYSQTQFTILDFEDALTGFEDSPNSLANLIQSSDPAIIQSFNGNSFGRVSLTEAMNTWISATDLGLDLPRNGAEVYLEIDYHNTVAVTTGVLGINASETAQNPNIRLNAQEPGEVEWKKIYIELKTIVSGSPNAEYFEHSFDAILDDDQTAGEINIDNIKVVHF